ncbi:hypothetical protein EV2_015793 [Malus domestica]
MFAASTNTTSTFLEWVMTDLLGIQGVQAGISLGRVPDSSIQLPEDLALLLLVGILQEEDTVGSKRCLCGALCIGLEAHNQN